VDARIFIARDELREMIAFFICLPGFLQDVFWTEFDTEAAAFAAVWNQKHLAKRDDSPFEIYGYSPINVHTHPRNIR
jgi:hypothetical protein